LSGAGLIQVSACPIPERRRPFSGPVRPRSLARVLQPPFTVFVLTWCLLLARAVAVAAQDQGRVGLTMWYPVGVGVVFGLSDRIALRPDFSLTRRVTEGITENTVNTWGVGLSALLYLQKSDSLSTYVSPRVAFRRSTERWQQYEPREVVIDSWQASGSLGAQYALVRRFTVFGEVGLAYTDQYSTGPIYGFFRKSQTWELRTIVGVTLLF
jgi:hypothetical protein